MTKSNVVVQLSVAGQAQVGQALAGVEQRLNAVQGAVRKVGHYGAALGVVLGTDLLGRLAGLGSGAVRAADAMTNMASRLRLLGNSGQAIAGLQEQIFKVAQASRVSFVDLADTYARVARATQNLGVSQASMLRVTQAVGDAMALSGGSAQSAQAALVQLGQGLASGTLRGEELNSIMEQSPRLAQALADGLGVPLGRLRALGEQGKLTSLAVVEALEKAGPQLAREMAQSTLTVGQAMTVLGNSATKFVGDVDRASGASAKAAGAIKSLSDAMSGLGRTVNSNATTMSVMAGAAEGVLTVGAIALAIGGVRAAFLRLAASVVAHPAAAAVLGVGAALGALSGVSDAQRAHRATQVGMNEELKWLDQLEERERRRGATVGEPVKARIAVLRASIQEFAQARADEFRKIELADRTGSAGGPFPGSLSMDELAKITELDIDIRKKHGDERVKIAQAYAQQIYSAENPEQQQRLRNEMQRRLAGNAIEMAQALDKKTQAAAQASAKLTLAREEALAGERTQTTQRALDALAATYAANLVDFHSYTAEKLRLEEELLAEERRIAQARLDAALAVPASAGPGGKDAKKSELVALRAQLAALQRRDPAADASGAERRRAGALDAARDLEEAQGFQALADEASAAMVQLEQANREAGIAMIRDDRERGEKQIDLFRREQMAKFEVLRGVPELYAQAQADINEAVRLKQEELTERLKPGWQKMVEGWRNAQGLMRDAANETMDSLLKGGEGAFEQLAQTGKLNIKSLMRDLQALAGRTLWRQIVGSPQGQQGTAWLSNLLGAGSGLSVKGYSGTPGDTNFMGPLEEGAGAAAENLKTAADAAGKMSNAADQTSAASGLQAAAAAANALGLGELGQVLQLTTMSMVLFEAATKAAAAMQLASAVKTASGAVFTGTARFAAGAAFTNSVVTASTLFRYRNGGRWRLGEMGEAGPEAIVPLSRRGAGFEMDAVDASGRPLPGGVRLARGRGGRLAAVVGDRSVASHAAGGWFGAALAAPAVRFAAGGVMSRPLQDAALHQAGAGGGGQGLSINQTIHVAPGADRNMVMLAMQQAKSAAVAEIEQRMQRNRAAYR